MTALLKCILLLLPLAVFGQYGPGVGNDLAGTGTDPLGGTGTQSPNFGGNGGLGGTGGFGGNGGAGGNDGIGNGATVPTGVTNNYNGQGNFGPGGGTGMPGTTVDMDSEEGSGGSSEENLSNNAGWGAGGGGLGLLKNPGQRWTVTILSCLLAIAVIALIAFFIVKRKRGGAGDAAQP